ncbi:MAG: LemA family protein [Burkholderiaceae bacterium]|jgi:LemA protein|nr:LemA family protein [Burkholderiaceae bacterium]
MSNFSLWLWVVSPLLFFWMVGAYNRLVRLRARVRQAFAALDEQAMRQLVWVQGCLPESMRGNLQTSPVDLQDAWTIVWARLCSASEQFAAALAHARPAVADAPTMAGVALAHEALRNALAVALAEAVAPDAVPSAERLRARWMRLLHQAAPVQEAFNETAQAYNDAIAQFPASIIARVVRFRPAGMLTRPAKTR